MDDEIAEIVRQYEWYAANVYDHEPPFLYTIGLLATHQHPELIIFGLEPEQAHALFSQLARNIAGGNRYAEAGVYPVQIDDSEFQVGFRSVHPTQHPLYFGFAMGFMR